VPLAVVAEREADIRQALAVGKDFGISVVIVGGAEAWRAAGSLASRRVPVILDPLDELPVSYDTLGARRDNAKILAEAGVTIGFMVSAQGIYLSYNVGPLCAKGGDRGRERFALRAGAARDHAKMRAHLERPRPRRNPGARRRSRPRSVGRRPAGARERTRGHFLNGSEISLRTRQTLLRDRYRPASEERQSAPASR